MALCAQSFRLEFSEDIPADAAKVLSQRFGQMLGSGGLSLSDDGIPLVIEGLVIDRVETSGSISQVALVIEISASAGEQKGVFPIKGVGDNDADAWARAVKQILPASKAAREFVEKLKTL